MFKPVSSKVNFPKVEEAILDYWDKNDTFKKSLNLRKNNKAYTFYKIPQKGETIVFNKANFDFYQPLIETYEGVQAGRLFDKIFINASESNSYTFKQNYYFVQGDNTEGSVDSRHWGLVAQSQLIGKSVYIQRKKS